MGIFGESKKELRDKIKALEVERDTLVKVNNDLTNIFSERPSMVHSIERNIEMVRGTVMVDERVPIEVLKRRMTRDMIDKLEPLIKFNLVDASETDRNQGRLYDAPYQKILIGELRVVRGEI